MAGGNALLVACRIQLHLHCMNDMLNIDRNYVYVYAVLSLSL